MQIQEFNARKILNSRKEETIEIRIKTVNGIFTASAPSGKSRGKREVFPFSSRGINFSVSFANAVGRRLIKEKISFEEFHDLEKVESLFREKDNTRELRFVGGNTLYAVEACILKAVAASHGKELWEFLLEGKKPILPFPVGNCIGGGKHTKEKNKPDFQEFLVIPKVSFHEAYFILLQSYKEARKLLKKRDKFFSGTLTDENSFVTSLENSKVIELIKEVKVNLEKKFGKTFDIGIDIAASSFYKKGKYCYSNFCGNKKKLSKEEQINYVLGLIQKYELSYVEDPLQEEDFESFSHLLSLVRKNHFRTLIVGDDLICTSKKRLEKAIKEKAINAVIIKPNQVGSLIETKETVDLAKKNKIIPIISHRSGETLDTTIAHLAVGWQIPFIKAGIIGKERAVKLHELLRIEKKVLGEKIY